MKEQRMPTACVIIATLMFIAMSASFVYSEVQAGLGLTNEDFIRFHVVANSDSEKDQALKLKVRDRVIEYIDNAMIREMVGKSSGENEIIEIDINDTRVYIMEHLDEIVKEAEVVLAEEGVEQEVRGEYGVSWIPEKEYGSLVFPAGNYEALKLLIGEASGHNWWCVLFPPLCLINSDNSEGNEEILKELIRGGKYNHLEKAAEEDSGRTVLKLKFKTLELVKRFSE